MSDVSRTVTLKTEARAGTGQESRTSDSPVGRPVSGGEEKENNRDR